ncbi:MAG: NAD(P)-dependent alcohol dehydrogenase [Kibdelosporangium sp.]
MKAITQDTYGSADVLEYKDIDKPVAGPDEVLVRIHAAAVDAGVWHLMTGMPYAVRLAIGLRSPRTKVRGRELSGTVEQVGANVTEFEPGDEVFGIADGSFAEYATAKPRKLARKPANISLRQAAALSISCATALRAIRDTGKVQPGQQVLIIGAAGGVGTFAVQIAKAYGAEVTGVCSTTKTELVRSLGADHVIDYTREPIPAGRYDVVIDIAGNRKVSLLRRTLAARGTLVFVGGENGGRWTGMSRSFGGLLLSPFVAHTLRSLIATERKEDLEAIRDLVESGKITPAIDRTCPLAAAPEAIRHLQAGNARGKIVVTV